MSHKSVTEPMKLLTAFILTILFAMPRPALAAAAPKQLLDSGRVDEAIAIFQQRIGQSPSDGESYNYLCRAYFMVDDWDHAISACERARDLDPHNSIFLLWLGRSYGEKADHARFLAAASLARKVRESFEQSVKLDPKSSAARTDLGEFYTEAPGIVGGGEERARQQAEALMKSDPARGHWLLARIAEKNKDAAGAEREYRAAIADSHSGVRAWFDLANFFFYAHRLDEMEQAIHTLESSPVDHPESLMHAAGVLLRANRDSPTAIRLLKRYIAAPVEEGPAFKAHTLLAQLLERRGDREAAGKEYRAALSLFHNYTAAREGLARLEH